MLQSQAWTEVEYSGNKLQQHKTQAHKSAITGECDQQHWDANMMQSAHKRERDRERKNAERKMRDEVHTPVLWDWN